MQDSNEGRSSYTLHTCCYCKSSDYRTVIKGPIVQIIKCCRCGLMRRGDVKNEAFSIVDCAGGRERYCKQRVDKERIQVDDYIRIIERLQSYLHKKGDLLEIGCATGELMERIQEYGWPVFGIEPEQWGYEKACEKGLKVQKIYFQDYPEKSRFMAILLLHVIEHLPDPYDGLKKIYTMLQPGGYLVLETPRFDTLNFKILRGRERSVIPGHLYYFTRSSLRQMAESSGYEVVDVHSVGRTLTLDRLCFSCSKVFNMPVITKALVKLSSAMRLNQYKVCINLHDMMRAYLRKNS